MDKEAAANLLRAAHNRAPYGQKTLTLHLVGIWHADALDRFNIRELREMAGIPRLEPTIRDGMNLAKVATINEYGRSLLLDLDLA